MTCIVGFIGKNKRMFIGADSAGSDSSGDINLRQDVKVFCRQGFGFGFTSSFRMGQLLQYSFQIPEQKEGVGDFEYMCTAFVSGVRHCFATSGYGRIINNEESGGEFIVVYRGNLFKIQSDYQVQWASEKFMSCGCGARYALGALKAIENMKFTPQTRIKEALKSAAYFSGAVAPPFIILEV